jgi:UDP-glucose 6-dehydrogenase
MKIGVIGAGRLGICFALLCEQAGYDVLVSDVREDYIKNLRNKFISTNEPEVSKLLSTSPRLSATTSNTKVIRECDIIYTLVATPSKKDGSYDVSAVWDVVDDFKKVKNVEGKAFVVGGLYNRIQETPPKISIMSTTAAELVKLAVNCFLTTKISYANMVGQVMALSGMEDEIPTVLGAIGDDSRVGRKYLNFGFGFGGPCLPRDNRAFSAYAKQLGLDYNLGETTDNFNNEHANFLKEYFVYRNVDNLPFYFDYVSYKKGTDILTESQQHRLCIDLLDDGYEVYINDIDAIMDRISDDLSDKYSDIVKFGEPDVDVYPIKF